jgi:hypothetical protein
MTYNANNLTSISTIGKNPYPRIFIAYILFIYLTLPFLPPVVKWMRSSMGDVSIAVVAPVLTGIITLIILAILARRHTLAIGRLSLLLAASAVILYIKRDNPVEQVHLVEYGLAGFLAHRAASFPGGARVNRASYAIWTAVALGAGILDELIQYLLPNRVCDWRDMVINVVSVPVGLAAAAIMGRPAAPPTEERGTSGPPA